jgi:prepilin-type processing-associated H-X9-DG protein
MRFTTRAFGLAVVAGLTAAVLLIRPGAEPTAAAAQPAALPEDLAMVPADAAGFVHVRAAELWKNEMFATFRETFQKAGPEALAALDKQFVPKISTFERFTGFVLLSGERQEPVPVAVLRFGEAFSTADVVKAYLPNAEQSNVGGKTVWASREAGFAMHFPDTKHIVISSLNGLRLYLGHAMPKDGPLSYGLKLAASGKPLVGAVGLASLPIPPQALQKLPPEVQTLLKAEHITGSVDLGATAKVEVTAGYKNADDAQAAEKAVKALAEFARKHLEAMKAEIQAKVLGAKGPRPASDLPEALLMVFALGAFNQLDEMLADPGKYVKRNGNDLTATVPLPKDLLGTAGAFTAVSVGLLLPAVQKVREAAARAQSANNLKQIAIAVHSYHDTHGHLPQDITDKNGKPLLSWRVAILPFIEQNNLYQRFKLDEPWDSPNNKPLSQAMIKVFVSPAAPMPGPGPDEWGVTHYQGFVGPGTVFEPGKKITLAAITDGTSNTILAIETADAVPWAKPGGIPFDPNKPLPKLRPVHGGGVSNAVFCDGAVRALAVGSIDEKTLKAMITRSGGEVIDPDR